MDEVDWTLLRSAFDQADDAIYITDRSAVILYANESTSRITGFSLDQLVGGRPSLFASGMTSQEYYARMWSSLLSGDAWREAITNRRCNGTLYECTQTLTPIKDSEQSIIGFIAVQRDMSAHSTVQYEMRAARSEVERALEEQQVLLREVTHRTKNDLELLRSMLSLQAATLTDADASAALEKAMGRVAVMGRMYHIFHERGEDPEASPCQLLDDLADYWRDTLFRANDSVSLTCEAHDLPNRFVVSLGIIANEIVTNAAKYAHLSTKPASLNVGLTVPQPGLLQLTVADSGPGFPAQVLDGTDRGLGLTMAESISRQYHGSLTLNNTKDQSGVAIGALVTVMLRYA
ncbi:MAG TPA: PAS domain S-box protein [Alkalispirochaeta sp.]|nr:PAS domain S-box protein [Alkalispirochaeta sp.]